MASDHASLHLMSMLGVPGLEGGHPEGAVPGAERSAPQNAPSSMEPLPTTSSNRRLTASTIFPHSPPASWREVGADHSPSHRFTSLLPPCTSLPPSCTSLPPSCTSLPYLESPSATRDLAHRLHVSNLPFRFRLPELSRLFSPFGSIADAEVIFNEKGSKGFGFVTLGSSEEALAARRGLDGVVVEGRVLKVSPATPKAPREEMARVVDREPTAMEEQRRLVEAQARLARARIALMQMQLKMEVCGTSAPSDHP